MEIAGNCELSGLEFFCTKVELPGGTKELNKNFIISRSITSYSFIKGIGDIENLKKSMEAMNTPEDPDAEERKGGSGAIGKMIFSCDEHALTAVAYVPEALAQKVIRYELFLTQSGLTSYQLT